MAERKRSKGSARTVFQKVALFVTLTFGFVSLIFTRDFGRTSRIMHDPTETSSRTGIAFADAPSCGDSGDSGDSSISSCGGGGDACDCDGAGSGGCGGGACGGAGGSGAGGDTGCGDSGDSG